MGTRSNARRATAARRLLLSAALCGVAFLSAADDAAAQAKAADVTRFQIAQQQLGDALKKFAEQSRLQLLFSEADLGGRSSPAIQGDYTPREALRQMLAGSGLTFDMTDAGSVVIRKPQGAPAPKMRGAELSPTTQTAPAAFPAAAKASAELDTITVTASRIARPGLTAPTATTVVGETDIRQSGATDIGRVLNDLPAFRATVTAATTSANTSSGRTQAELRGVGVARTLVLIDGHRPVPTSNAGFDLNMVPFSLVKRVEVVTGGASAAWGSDAVAGVVNIILDHSFEGVKGEASYGISTYGDNREFKLMSAAGMQFAGGRGHVMVDGEFVKNKGIQPRTARSYAGDWALLANPTYTASNGQPQYLLAPDVHYAVASVGGLIVSGPLAGQQFGPGGVLTPFRYGINRGSTYMQGGDGVSNNDFSALIAPTQRANGYLNGSIELTDSLKLTGEIAYAHATSGSDFYPETGTLTLRPDNPFMPAAVRSQMAALGLTSLAIGRVNADFGSIHNNVLYQQIQGTIGLEGTIGKSWKWNGYYSYGHTDHDNDVSNLRITSLFANSIDVVANPANGQPICRSTLTNPTNGCVPVNVFGPNAASPAAAAYFEGTASLWTDLTQHVASVSTSGDAFSTWAGPVSVAFGGEWRRQTIDAVPDALSAVGAFTFTNQAALKGAVNVKEAFTEVNVPLLADVPFAKAVDLNGAVRYSDYTPGASVTSWKVGMTYRVNDELRLRATRSRDMRAPALTEMYLQRRLNIAAVLDPFTNRQSSVNIITSGNTSLQPERAYTSTAGAIYQPRWAPGFYASADYYDIRISGAIGQLSALDTLTRCYNGNTALCGLVTRDGTGTVTQVQTPTINLSAINARGVDFEFGYRQDRLDLRLVGTRVLRAERLDNNIRTTDLGNIGGATGVPRWRFVASGSYLFDTGTLVDLRARYLGGGAYDSNYRIDDNTVPSRTYFDLSVEQRLPGKYEAFTIYANVRNLLNTDPPTLANPAYFDMIGRMFHVGARFSF